MKKTIMILMCTLFSACMLFFSGMYYGKYRVLKERLKLAVLRDFRNYQHLYKGEDSRVRGFLAVNLWGKTKHYTELKQNFFSILTDRTTVPTDEDFRTTLTSIQRWGNLLERDIRANSTLPDNYPQQLFENVSGNSKYNASFKYKIRENGTVAILKYLRDKNDLTIPTKISGNRVTRIGERAFALNDKLITLKLPDSVRSIGAEAMLGCSNLETVRMPSKLERIGNKAFYNCASLSSVSIPDTVKNIGEDAFSGCEHLNSIKIPHSVSSIGSGVFLGCRNLIDVKIAAEIETIPALMFAGCESLKSIKIPKSVQNIANGAFSECATLNRISIPGKVTRIGPSAFTNCDTLASVKIPSNIEEIGSEAFRSCNNLRYAEFMGDAPESIGQHIFDDCHADFRVYYHENAKGFSESNWQGYPRRQSEEIFAFGN